MTYPNSQKTVIVLDHGPALGHSSQEPVEYDVFNKSRGPGIIPLAPIAKSMWTCMVEGAVEYARIVWDIYPNLKVLRLVASDSESRSLNSWDRSEQNLQQLMLSLATIGPANRQLKPKECNIAIGLTEAIKLLCEPTLIQQSLDDGVKENEPINKGRIICLTNLTSDNQVPYIEESVLDAINEHNKLVPNSDGRLITLDHCDLELVHMYPVGTISAITPREKNQVSALLTTEVHSSQSGHFIANKLVELCAKHYNLASTCITGIPMKEEQNASSSANYDVELLHPAAAHYELYKSGHSEGLVIPSKEGLYMNTITLKWCTPKTNAVELQHCTGAYRLTPVDVNSRPSSCLTNFLLSGRAVMLEQPRKTQSNKVISHMLASHGGEIFIHVLSTVRSILEDPPSISEGVGGRITDYRINDYGELMKESRLAPGPSENPTIPSDKMPSERARMHLERYTRVWPLTINDTIIFNMLSHLDPLPSLIVKSSLDSDEVLDCKKAILHVVGMESNSEPLPASASSTRGKGPKRDEQYRQMWNELEKLIRAHSGNSSGHAQILECLLECKRPSEGSSTQDSSNHSSKENESDTAWKQLDRYGKMTEREKSDLNKSREFGEPLNKKQKVTEPLKKNPSGQSLLSMWSTRLNAIHIKKCKEFAGRLENSDTDTAQLYIHLDEKEDITDIKLTNSSTGSRPHTPTGGIKSNFKPSSAMSNKMKK